MSDDEKVAPRLVQAPKVTPRLPTFSGREAETPFEQWEFEVQCLIREGWPDDEVRLLIRRSLKGQASRTLMNLGTDASVAQVLAKFRTVFGPVLSSSSVMANFYSLRQADGEDAGTFATRLEDCAHQAVQLGRVTRADLDQLLKEAFGAGLRQATKMATGFLLGVESLSFDQLVLEVKRRERDLGLGSSTSVAAVQPSEVERLSAQIAQLTTELSALKNRRGGAQTQAPNRRPLSSRKTHSRQSATRSSEPVTLPPQGYGSEAPFPGFSFAAGTGQSRFPQPTQSRQASSRPNIQGRTRGPITCFRCGQEGHVSSGCRNVPGSFSRPAETRQSLNWALPVVGGYPQAFPPAYWAPPQ